MRQIVLPIKDDKVLKDVQDTLLHNFKAGRRNYTIFQVGKATLLRVSDVLRLKQSDVFDDYGAIKQNAYIVRPWDAAGVLEFLTVILPEIPAIILTVKR